MVSVPLILPPTIFTQWIKYDAYPDSEQLLALRCDYRRGFLPSLLPQFAATAR
jgi:hypothetical protein